MEPVPASEADYDATMLVSVMLADDVSFECVLAMHSECYGEHVESGVGLELLTVTALGRAMIRAAEAGLTRRESKSQAAGGQSPQTQRSRRPH